MDSRPQRGSPGRPQLRPHPVLLQDHLLGSNSTKCALRVTQQPHGEGGGTACPGTECLAGAILISWVLASL